LRQDRDEAEASSGVGDDAEAAEGRDIPDGLFAEEDDDPPGPLTLAASAARVEAEARIRAAMLQAGSSATRHSDSSHAPDSPASDSPASDSRGDEDQPEIALAWGGPALSLRQVSESAVAPRAATKNVGHADGDDETEDDHAEDDAVEDDDTDPPAEDRPERSLSLSSYVRRGRIACGSLPRLSWSKRSGAVPGR
jgi:hypothetical protein